MVSSRLITPKFVLSVSTDVGRNLTGERIRTTISYKMYFAKVKEKVAGTQVFKLNRPNGLLTHSVYCLYSD